MDTVVFDKTGTLTDEQPHVTQIHPWGDYEENEILRYAAAAEYTQTHPIAQAILQEARTRDVYIPAIDEATYRIGYGLTVTADSRPVHVGSFRFMEMEEIFIPPSIREVQAVCHNQGHSLVLVAMDYQVVGAIELHAAVRPEAKAMIQGLRQRNIKHIYIISGDHDTPTQKLATALGIDHYFPETLPESKADLIEQLQQEGRSVCYIGDGINDAIALKKAEVSISFRGASTIAMDTAQVILMDQSLNQLCRGLRARGPGPGASASDYGGFQDYGPDPRLWTGADRRHGTIEAIVREVATARASQTILCGSRINGGGLVCAPEDRHGARHKQSVELDRVVLDSVGSVDRGPTIGVHEDGYAIQRHGRVPTALGQPLGVGDLDCRRETSADAVVSSGPCILFQADELGHCHGSQQADDGNNH